jgi:DNA-binding NarL/FixJ family response regulator
LVRNLPVRVLALSSYDDDRYVQEMLEAGETGYLLKDEAPVVIVAAVRAAARGERLWTMEQFARARRWREEVQERWSALTEREREVLALVAARKSNKEIAQALNVTVRTVEFHVSNVLGKLGLTSRVEAAVWVKEHKLCD